MKILLTGGSGFVGKEITRRLIEIGYLVRVLNRRAEKRRSHPSVEFFQGDVTHPETLQGCCKDVSAVIHLVGIITEQKKQTFTDVHVNGTQNILQETQRAGVSRFIHMSAMGTQPHTPSRYYQTKWQAEELVRKTGLAWTIFQPSVIYGENDDFINRLKGIMRWTPVMPCFGGGKTVLRPISVETVADCVVRSIGDARAVEQTVELGGAPVTFRELLKSIGLEIGRKPLLMPVPFWAAHVAASVMEKLPFPAPITRDQLIMLE